MNRVPASILFVCTGNTCRSPMAAALCTRLIAKHYPEYQEQIKIFSAGCAAFEGSPATAEAITAMAAKDIALDDHQAKKVEASLLGAAELIVTMGEGNYHQLITNWPAVGGRLYTLREWGDEVGDVVDPLGQGQAAYDQTSEELERLIKIMLKKLLGDSQKFNK